MRIRTVELKGNKGGYVGSTVEIATARPNGSDEFFRSNNPRNTPAGKAEPLGETVNDEDVIFVYVFDVVSRGDDGAIAIGGVVVTLTNQSGTFLI